MKKTGVRCAAMILLCAALMTIGILSVAAESEDIPVVSFGLNVLAAQTDMAVSAPIGNEITFSEDAFARAMNLSEVRYVTVKSLPAVTDGELLLGSTRVAAGQTVSAENLPYLSFCAADNEVTHSFFTFSVNGSATATVCNLDFMEEINYTQR